MFGHIQMASIEMKQYTKKISMDNDNWSRHENIKAAYTSIYETSKNIIDSTAKVIKFIVSNYPNVDCATFKDKRKELTKFRENNADTLKNIRNTISAHRDKDVTVQIDMIENVHLSDALQLMIKDVLSIKEYLKKAWQEIMETECHQNYCMLSKKLL